MINQLKLSSLKFSTFIIESQKNISRRQKKKKLVSVANVSNIIKLILTLET